MPYLSSRFMETSMFIKSMFSRLSQHLWNSATSSPTPAAPLPEARPEAGRPPKTAALEARRHGRPVASSPDGSSRRRNAGS